MKELKGKVAAVTGAASGLGRSMALAFAAEGMDVALADVDQANLSSVADEVQAKGVRAITLRVDVSQADQVEAFRDQTLARLGAIHVVCNNAGVSPLGAVWENTPADWQWILGVNLWGVINGVRAFTRTLIAQNEGHIVNTASVSGLIAPPGSGAYNVTKHAVVALSESLHHDLRERNSAVGVSVLCPAYVPTGIVDSERSRPKDLPKSEKSRETLAKETMLRKAVTSGKVSADQVAQAVVAAVKEERFYILTHPRIKGAIQARMEDILEGRAPRNPMAL
ncbi:MAG TPA: SDR family NAD(P)-dependent oxidoreductase [Burkholderiales bacterium]|nr:SDR family NAD(P)-dependent oxidoreductase [Burkholderiales bacterium]